MFDIGVVITVVLAGIASFIAYLLYLDALPRERAEMVPEPGTTIALGLSYLALAYLTVYLVRLQVALAPVTAGLAVLIGALGIHFTLKHSRRTRVRLTRSLAPRAVGFERTYPSVQDLELQQDFSRDLQSATRVRVWSHPDTGVFSNPGNPVQELLILAASRGRRVTLLTSRDATPPPRGIRVNGSVLTAPEFWLVDLGVAMYQGTHGHGTHTRDTMVVRICPTEASYPATGPYEALRDLVDRLEEESAGDSFAGTVFIGRGPEAYSASITTLEAQAYRIDRLAKRLFVIFKPEEMVKEIAVQRYGAGNPRKISAYVDDHALRREAIFSGLDEKLMLREIYSKADLITYVTRRQQSSGEEIPVEHVRRMLALWKRALQRHDRYYVALTDAHVPLHYEIINGTSVVLHEAVGGHDDWRLNSVFVNSELCVGMFAAEFDALWDRAEHDKVHVIDWIETVLEKSLA